ncbi:MAG: hypothetical protein IKT46_07610 [Clostridia bacterium]|nr:hypothetical protein [Clostridia bacterium]
MKKTIVCMLIAVMLVLSSVSVLAYDDSALTTYLYGENNEVGSLVAKNGTPTIDGNISTGEGWSAAKAIDYTNMPTLWGPSSRCIIKGNVYFAWNTNGLYVGADITDPTKVLSKGEGEPDDSGMNEYGYDGDVFVMGIDPVGACFDAGMVSNDDFTAWYCMSLLEDGTFKVYRSQHNEADITDNVTGAARTTNTGWALECMIPWDTIIDDTMVASLGDVQLTVDEITTLGAVSNVGIMYLDRAVMGDDVRVFASSSDETPDGEIFTLSRNVSVPLVHADGQGWGSGTSALRSYGLKLAMGDTAGVAPETETKATEPVETEPVATEEPDETEEKADDTTKKKETVRYDENGNLIVDDGEGDEANTTGGSGLLGLGVVGIIIIAAIAVAVVAVVVVVVIVVIKKKKSNK